MTLKIQISSSFPASPLASQTQIITGSGTTVVLASTTLIIFDKSVISDSPCTLPSVLLRSDADLDIYDFTGKAGKITLTPFAGETVMGSSNPWELDSGGVAQSGAAAKFRSVKSLLGWVAR